MLLPVAAAVWGYLTVEGENAHIHELQGNARVSAYVQMPIN